MIAGRLELLLVAVIAGRLELLLLLFIVGHEVYMVLHAVASCALGTASIKEQQQKKEEQTTRRGTHTHTHGLIIMWRLVLLQLISNWMIHPVVDGWIIMNPSSISNTVGGGRQRQQQRRQRAGGPYSCFSTTTTPTTSYCFGQHLASSLSSSYSSSSFLLSSSSSSTDTLPPQEQEEQQPLEHEQLEQNTQSSSLSSSSSSSSSLLSLAEQTRPDFPILHQLLTDNNNDDKSSSSSTNNSHHHRHLIYLDSAATSQKPQQVIDCITNYYQTQNANVHRGSHTLSRLATNVYEEARNVVANFIHATCREEIIFTSGATDALNLLAHTHGQLLNSNNHNKDFFLQPGDEILLTVAEHHANLVPWQHLAQEKNCTLRFVPLTMDGTTLDWETALIGKNNNNNKKKQKNQHDDKEEEEDDDNKDDDNSTPLLNSRTKLVAFQHVSNVLGVVNPVEELVKIIRQKGNENVRIVLDACQSIPHMIVNVQELQIDFLVGSGHKLCGPTGIGFLWGRKSLINQLPPYKYGGEMIDIVTLTKSTYLSCPARFEAGTPPIAQAIGMAKAMQYLQSLNMTIVEAYEYELGCYLYQQLSQVPDLILLGPPPLSSLSSRPLSLINNNKEEQPLSSSTTSTTSSSSLMGHRGAALVSFTHKTIHASDLSAILDSYGVAVRAGHHCCQPLHHELGLSHSVRASCAFYNTFEYVCLVCMCVLFCF